MELNECCMTKLLVESNDDKPGVLSTVSGTFMELDIKNRNGRIYPRDLVLERIMQSNYVQEMLESRMLLGEAKHPEDRFEVDMEKASHVITNLWIDEEENVLKGKADILDTPCGRIVDTLVRYGSSVGISARARGNVKNTKEGQVVLKESYNFKTFDFVLTPGFAKSRLEKVNEDLDLNNTMSTIINESSDKVLSEIKTILESVDKEYFKDSIKLIEEKQENTTDELMELVKENTDLELQVEELKLEKLAMENELNKITEERDNLMNTLSDYSKNIDKLQENVNNLKGFEEVNSLLLESNKTMKNRLDSYTSLLINISETVNTLREKVNTLEAMVEERNEEIDKRDKLIVDKNKELEILKESLTMVTDSLVENRVEYVEDESPVVLVESVYDGPINNKLANLVGGIKNGK